MPYSKQLSGLQSSSLAVIFNCSLEYGICHLIQDLHSSDKPLVWLELDPLDQDDPIWLGNRLAETVNKVFETRLLNSFSYEYTLVLLQTLLSKLGPITLAVTQAHLVPEFARAVLKLHSKDCRIVLQYEEGISDLELPAKYLEFDQKDLKLSQKEALELVKSPITEKKFLEIWKETDGAYDLLMSRVHRFYKLPPHVLPGPSGQRTLRGFDIETRAEALLKLYIRKQRWLEALEFSCERFPEQVPDILIEAGHSYHEQGLHKRLFRLLEDLPEDLKQDETVLYWRLQAAFRLGKEGELRKEVTGYLKKNEAPELRAMAAGVFVPTNRKEALRAYRARKTAFTTYQLARLTYGEPALKLFRESMELAETEGKPYEVVRNMGSYAAALAFQGYYQEAASWCQQALQQFDKLGIKDGQRRLFIVNEWAHARIFTGDIAGLEELLLENESQLMTAYPDLASLFRSTLGDYYVVTDQLDKAITYYQINVEKAPQSLLAYSALDLVPAQIALGMYEEALKIALRAYNLTKNLTDIYSLRGHLAHSIVHLKENISLSQRKLIDIRTGLIKINEARRIAQASLYLALSYFQSSELAKCRKLLHDPKSHLADLSLSGLRLVSGPEKLFRPIWNMLNESKPASLEIRLLGKKEVWLEGEPVKLFPSWLEILAVLAIEQRPLEIEELMMCLYGDGGSKNTLKANLAKMRQVLPISQHPYHIQGSFQADFIDVGYYLKKGNLVEAVKHYGGPMLRTSESPSIRAKDEELSESLCKYALETSDVEALMRLSELIPDDLRLLDRLFHSLDKSDPRAPSVKARVDLVRNTFLDTPARKKRSKANTAV